MDAIRAEFTTVCRNCHDDECELVVRHSLQSWSRSTTSGSLFCAASRKWIHIEVGMGVQRS